MKRRTVLAAGGLGIGGGYLGWTWYQSPTVPDGMTVETLYVGRNILASAPSREGMASQEERHAIIEDEDAAANDVVDIESVTEFVEATDFAESYLLVVQNGMQSQLALELAAIDRTETGLHLDISIDSPWFGVDDDLVTHSLAIRITDENTGIPGDVTLDIDGYV